MYDALIGTRKGLFGLRGEACELVGFLGAPVTAVLTDQRDGAVYAALDHGHFGVKLQRSDDGGVSFTEIATPEYPEPAEGEVAVSPVTGEPIPWTTSLLWELAAGHPDDEGALWAGTIPGGLFRSSDRGDSWQLVRSLWDEPSRPNWFGGGYDHPGIHSVSVDPRGAGELLVGISCGGAWRSGDGGSTWEVSHGMRAAFMPPEMATEPTVQDPHRLARCRDEPDVVWCQHHNGIFRSTDGGSTFVELSDAATVGPVRSAFGFAVAAHPSDPDTAWFVPAVADEVRVPVGGRVVVSRTTDGGQSFEALGDGLPASGAYDLVYRHALSVDASGERLLLGSTTGSLWCSTDGGATFEAISTHLPPIACVSWANPG